MFCGIYLSLDSPQNTVKLTLYENYPMNCINVYVLIIVHLKQNFIADINSKTLHSLTLTYFKGKEDRSLAYCFEMIYPPWDLKHRDSILFY